MSLEPVQSNACARERKGSRGWIFILTFFGVAARASSGARIGIRQTNGQALVFANKTLPALHMLWSSRVLGLRICNVIDEFPSLQRTLCRFDEKCLNSFQGQAEETLMSQVLSHLAVNVPGSGSQQRCALESKGSRGWIFTLTFCGVAACASSGARIGILQTNGQACRVLANRTLPALHMLWSSRVQELRVCHTIDEFHSLQRTRCRFDKKSLNRFHCHAEETLMLQVLCWQ